MCVYVNVDYCLFSWERGESSSWNHCLKSTTSIIFPVCGQIWVDQNPSVVYHSVRRFLVSATNVWYEGTKKKSDLRLVYFKGDGQDVWGYDARVVVETEESSHTERLQKLRHAEETEISAWKFAVHFEYCIFTKLEATLSSTLWFSSCNNTRNTWCKFPSRTLVINTSHWVACHVVMPTDTSHMFSLAQAQKTFAVSIARLATSLIKNLTVCKSHWHLLRLNPVFSSWPENVMIFPSSSSLRCWFLAKAEAIHFCRPT